MVDCRIVGHDQSGNDRDLRGSVVRRAAGEESRACAQALPRASGTSSTSVSCKRAGQKVALEAGKPREAQGVQSGILAREIRSNDSRGACEVYGSAQRIAQETTRFGNARAARLPQSQGKSGPRCVARQESRSCQRFVERLAQSKPWSSARDGRRSNGEASCRRANRHKVRTLASVSTVRGLRGD